MFNKCKISSVCNVYLGQYCQWKDTYMAVKSLVHFCWNQEPWYLHSSEKTVWVWFFFLSGSLTFTGQHHVPASSSCSVKPHPANSFLFSFCSILGLLNIKERQLFTLTIVAWLTVLKQSSPFLPWMNVWQGPWLLCFEMTCKEWCVSWC